MQALNDKKGMSYSLNNIGNVYVDLDENEKALNYYQRSLKLKEELGDKKGIASATNNIGLVLFRKNEHFKALGGEGDGCVEFTGQAKSFTHLSFGSCGWSVRRLPA